MILLVGVFPLKLRKAHDALPEGKYSLMVFLPGMLCAFDFTGAIK